MVIITSNRTREVHDALKRRCFYHWVDYPDFGSELAILNRKAPDAGDDLKAQLVAFVQRLRQQNMFKAPGVAETIDWAQALVELNCVALDPQTVDKTMGILLKYQDDIARIQAAKRRILAEFRLNCCPHLLWPASMCSRPSACSSCRYQFARLAENFMLFVRLMRAGLKVGPSAMLDAVRCVRLVGIEKKPYLYHTLTASLLSRPEDRALFDRAFHLFWRNQFMEQMRNVLLPQMKTMGVESIMRCCGSWKRRWANPQTIRLPLRN